MTPSPTNTHVLTCIIPHISTCPECALYFPTNCHVHSIYPIWAAFPQIHSHSFLPNFQPCSLAPPGHIPAFLLPFFFFASVWKLKPSVPYWAINSPNDLPSASFTEPSLTHTGHLRCYMRATRQLFTSLRGSFQFPTRSQPVLWLIIIQDGYFTQVCPIKRVSFMAASGDVTVRSWRQWARKKSHKGRGIYEGWKFMVGFKSLPSCPSIATGSAIIVYKS